MTDEFAGLLRERAYIGGDWVDAGDDARQAVDDPATEETIGQVPDLAAADIDTAIDAAVNAFAAGATPRRWSAPTSCWRGIGA